MANKSTDRYMVSKQIYIYLERRRREREKQNIELLHITLIYRRLSMFLFVLSEMRVLPMCIVRICDTAKKISMTGEEGQLRVEILPESHRRIITSLNIDETEMFVIFIVEIVN